MLSGGSPLLLGLALSMADPGPPGMASYGSMCLTYAGCDGRDRHLFFRCLLPFVATQPPVVLLHFTSGHSGNMLPVACELVQRGYPVYVPDLPGHGHSSPTKRFFEDALLGIDALCRHVHREHGARKIGLAGSSLGGDLATLFALYEANRQNCLGIEPLVGSVVGQGLITLWQRDVSRHFSLSARLINLTEPIPFQWLMPLGIQTCFLFRPNQLYDSHELRRKFRNDALRRRAFSAALVIRGNRFQPGRIETAVATPMLMLVGDRDRIVRLRYERRVFRGLARYFENLQMLVVEGATHGMFEEHAYETTYLIDNWFRETLTRDETAPTAERSKFASGVDFVIREPITVWRSSPQAAGSEDGQGVQPCRGSKHP